MAEFTILRINECNKIVYNVMHGPKRWLFFWAAAVILLFLNLGNSSALSGEAAYMAAASEIMQDPAKAFTLAVNEHNAEGLFVYRYWFTVLPSLFTGIMNEFSSRVFSALAAVMLLGCSVSICKNLFDEKTAFLSGWLLLTNFSFALYGRMAEPIMLSGAWIMAAIAWWIHCRGRRSSWDCFVFFAICAFGTQYAGLPGWGIPCFAVLFYWVLIRQKKPDWNKACIVGACWGILLYVLPGILEQTVLLKTREAGSPLSADLTALVLKYGKQLVIPGIEPIHFTRQYCRDLLYLTMPWTPLFLLIPLNLIWKWKTYKNKDVSEIWLTGLLVLIILYSLCYSDLKILLTLLLTMISAVWFTTSEGEDRYAERGMQLILKVLLWIASLGVLAALLLPFMYGRLFTALSGFFDDSEITMQQMLGLSYVFYFGFPLLALLILSVWGIRRFRKNKSFFMPESWGSLDYLIPFCYGVSLFVFAVLYPIWNGNDHFQGKRLFYAGIRELADERPVVLIGDDLSGAACYLGQFGKVKLEQYRLIPDDPDMQQALEDRLLEAGNNGAVIAAACQTLNRLPENLQQQLSWPSDPGSLKMTEHGLYKESMSLSDLWKQCPEKTDQKCYNTRVFIKIFPGKSH